jgi:uncharacterized DUF497 family protein
MGPTQSPIQPREARPEFAEAVSVFSNPLARIFPDEEHSVEESREIVIGYSVAKHLLLVSFAEPGTGRVRIIGARRATRAERQGYEEHVAN